MNEQEWEDKLAEVQKNSEHWYNKYKELENKIADIKANCDLAIEGRDVKIKELEKKLEQTEKDLADYQFNYPKIKELEQTNNKLLDVINNQDVKIADLEKENAELTERLEDLQEQNSEMFNTIALQEQQIEKMKCCPNCDFIFRDGNCYYDKECKNKDHWKLKEETK